MMGVGKKMAVLATGLTLLGVPAYAGIQEKAESARQQRSERSQSTRKAQPRAQAQPRQAPRAAPRAQPAPRARPRAAPRTQEAPPQRRAQPRARDTRQSTPRNRAPPQADRGRNHQRHPGRYWGGRHYRGRGISIWFGHPRPHFRWHHRFHDHGFGWYAWYNWAWDHPHHYINHHKTYNIEPEQFTITPPRGYNSAHASYFAAPNWRDGFVRVELSRPAGDGVELVVLRDHFHNGIGVDKWARIYGRDRNDTIERFLDGKWDDDKMPWNRNMKEPEAQSLYFQMTDDILERIR